MQHYILRCKNCQREYTFCTYGNGPEYGTEEGCSMEYCSDCQKALDSIPKKFEPREFEIKEPMLLTLFDKIRDENQPKVKAELNGNQLPFIVSIPDRDNYDIIETIQHKNKLYKVKWDEDKPDKKHIFIMMEYDILNKKFTNKVWRYDGEDSYTQRRNATKILANSFMRLHTSKIVPLKEMTPPKGDLFFTDINWDINIPHKENHKKEHILRVHESTGDGLNLKLTAKYGWYQTKVKLAKGINVKNLIDFVDYKYTYEQYDDEDFATIVKIECV